MLLFDLNVEWAVSKNVLPIVTVDLPIYGALSHIVYS